MLCTPRDCIYTSKITKRCSSVEIILIKMKCPYRRVVHIPQNNNSKIPQPSCRGNQNGTNFQVSQQNYVTLHHSEEFKKYNMHIFQTVSSGALLWCLRQTGVQTDRCADGQVYRRTGVQMDRCADGQANSCLFSAAASVLTPFFCAILTHIITSFSCDFCFNAVRKTT